MPQRVVEILEVVQVDKQQSPPPPTTLARRHRLPQPLQQQASIRQFRQRIVERQMPDLILRCLGIGNIPCHGKDARHALQLNQRCRHQPPEYLAVLPPEARLEVPANPLPPDRFHHPLPIREFSPDVQFNRAVPNHFLPRVPRTVQECFVTFHVQPVAQPVQIDGIQ